VSTPVVQVEGLVKRYGDEEAGVQVLHGVDLCIRKGEIVALCGPSGSGKSTLLNLLGCLDRPTAGIYRLEGKDVSQLDRTAQARVRLHYLGFVFQSFHLLPEATALENVALPLQYKGVSSRERDGMASKMLERVGLMDRLDHRPNQLSGGQKQRVAIARALVTKPKLLLADEPTGALDSRTGSEVLRLLDDLHREGELTVVLVTHDPEVAAWAHRRVDLLDGRVVSSDPAPSPPEGLREDRA
jgi:putative ABC transport system ATP-binding protein